MQFLKAHYEKFILSIVLLGLAAAAALMPMKVSQERQREEERRARANPDVKPLTQVDLSTNQQVLERVSQPPRVTLAGEHNVFNPVRWQKRPADGSIYRARDAGPAALKIEAIRPLRLRLEFEQVTGTTQDVRYRVMVLNETTSSRPTPRDATEGDKNRMFTLEKVIGEDKTNPEALMILLPGDTQPVRVTKQEPHERVVGYAADLRHTVENRAWNDLRVKDEVSFGGETYNIVAITEDEVVLSAKSNKKQTVLELNAAK